jgi:hypothetical protein
MEKNWTISNAHKNFLDRLREHRLDRLTNDFLYSLRLHWDIAKQTEKFLRPALQKRGLCLFQMICEATPPAPVAKRAKPKPPRAQEVQQKIVHSLCMLPDDLAWLVAVFVGPVEIILKTEVLQEVPEWQDGQYGQFPQPPCCVKTV